MREFTVYSPYAGPGNYPFTVMADIDETTGKVIDLYCDHDGIPSIEIYESDKTITPKVKPGKNPLFVHIERKAHVLKMMVENGWHFLTADPSEGNDMQEDIEVINKYMSVYDFSRAITPYTE